MRIRNIVHKGLRRLVEDDVAAGLPADAVPKLRRIVDFRPCRKPAAFTPR